MRPGFAANAVINRGVRVQIFDIMIASSAASIIIGTFMDQNEQRIIGRWTNRKMTIAVGLLIAAFGPALWYALQPSSRSLLFWLCWFSCAGGLAWALMGAWLPQGRLLSLLRMITGNAVVFALMLGVAEMAFRVIQVNFNDLMGQNDDPRAKYPLCFRMPEKPLGEVFFQRAGPDSWTGQPLASLLRLKNGTDQAYTDEKSFTSNYDADGFRNPEGLKDWQVVVVGDSFVESGMLPFEQIFTTLAAQDSGLSIRNLGVCNTGTLSHLEYLRRFGKSPSTQRAVLAFYDGNDILDTETETADLTRHRQTGWRPSRVPLPQTSLIKAAYQVAKIFLKPSPKRQYQDAWLKTGAKELPITIRPEPMPLDPETMSPDQKRILDDSIQQWAESCHQLNLEPWLLYIPANNRTYHGLVRFAEHANAAAQKWTPGTLPDYMHQLCDKHQIHFVDACPTLRDAAEKGILVYNPILDTHLNQQGSQLIGTLLSHQLTQAATTGEAKPQP